MISFVICPSLVCRLQHGLDAAESPALSPAAFHQADQLDADGVRRHLSNAAEL